jgi:Fur family transcriptional regulator, zinc uptake regulator
MNKQAKSSTVGFTTHDHNVCVKQALAQADSFCRDNHLRFTKVRRRTLGILLESHVAMGAYEVLDRLKSEGLGSKPPIAYRALGFLLDNGFVHRIERLNAFIACSHPGASHHPAFLICTDCGSIAESAVSPNTDALSQTARQNGFQIQHTTLEAEGQCPDCQQ